MSLRTGYRLSLFWLSVVAILSAVDFGIAAGRVGEFLRDIPDNLLSTLQVVLHVSVLLGLISRRRWGWGLAGVWLPSWILYTSIELFRGQDFVYTLLWTPFLALTAFAHRFLVRDEVRKQFGIGGWPWTSFVELPPYVITVIAFVPLSMAVDVRAAAAVCFSAMIAVKTAPRVYEMGEG